MKWLEINKTENFLFVESAILFESGFNAFVDKVILMTASKTVRIARVVKRDRISVEQVRARMENQQPDDTKISRSDFVIHTDDNQSLDIKMKNIVVELLKSRG